MGERLDVSKGLVVDTNVWVGAVGGAQPNWDLAQAADDKLFVVLASEVIVKEAARILGQVVDRDSLECMERWVVIRRVLERAAKVRGVNVGREVAELMGRGGKADLKFLEVARETQAPIVTEDYHHLLMNADALEGYGIKVVQVYSVWEALGLIALR